LVARLVKKQHSFLINFLLIYHTALKPPGNFLVKVEIFSAHSHEFGKICRRFFNSQLTVAEFQKLLSFFVASSTNQQQRIFQIKSCLNFSKQFLLDFEAKETFFKQEVGFPKLKLLKS
jgi:hypothetical protein